MFAMASNKTDFNKLFKSFEKSISTISSKADMENMARNLATRHKINEKSKLLNFFKYKLFISLSKKINIEKLTDGNIQKLKQTQIKGFKFIESDLKKILKRSIYLATRFGFTKSFSENRTVTFVGGCLTVSYFI